MKKYFSLLIASIVLVALASILPIPVQGIITGYRIAVSPAKVAPGGIFSIQIEAAAFTGQMFDVYLSTDGYASGTNLVKKLAEGVKVVDVIVSTGSSPTDYVNITLMMPEDVEPGTGYYIKITDDGGSTWAVSNEMEVLDPTEYYIDFLNGTHTSYAETTDAGDYFVFNVTTAEAMEANPILKFVAIKEMKLYWIKDYRIKDFTDYFTEAKPSEGGKDHKYYTVWSQVKDFALPNLEGKVILLAKVPIKTDTETEIYVMPGMVVIHPSITVSAPSPPHVGETFDITLHNFPNETAEGEAINVTKIVLTDAAGIKREIETAGGIIPGDVPGPGGRLELTDIVVPPLQGGGVEDGVKVSVEVNATLEVTVKTAAFTIEPSVVGAWVANPEGKFGEVEAGTEVPGDYVLLNGSGFLIDGETFKVKFYNVSAEESFNLEILDSELRDDGYAAFLVQLPKVISEKWNGKFKLNVTGTTATNFLVFPETGEYTIEIPTTIDYTPTGHTKLFVNPIPTVEEIKSGDVKVDQPLIIEGIGFGGYDVANVTAIRPEGTTTIWRFTAHGFEEKEIDVEKYAVDLGLHKVKCGYFYVETTMPHAPQGTYTIWANESDTAVRVQGKEFEITPTIVTVSPTEDLAPGDTITIVGYGFPENLDVQFIWDMMFPVYVTSNGVGDVSATLAVPPLAPGMHTLAEPITGDIYTVTVKDVVHETLLEKLDELTTAVEDLVETVSGVPAAVEEKLGPIASAQETLSSKVSDLEGRVASLESAVSELSTKVDAVSASIGNVMTATIGSAVVVIIVLAIAVFVITRRKP